MYERGMPLQGKRAEVELGGKREYEGEWEGGDFAWRTITMGLRVAPGDRKYAVGISTQTSPHLIAAIRRLLPFRSLKSPFLRAQCRWNACHIKRPHASYYWFFFSIHPSPPSRSVIPIFCSSAVFTFYLSRHFLYFINSFLYYENVSNTNGQDFVN